MTEGPLRRPGPCGTLADLASFAVNRRLTGARRRAGARGAGGPPDRAPEGPRDRMARRGRVPADVRGPHADRRPVPVAALVRQSSGSGRRCRTGRSSSGCSENRGTVVGVLAGTRTSTTRSTCRRWRSGSGAGRTGRGRWCGPWGRTGCGPRRSRPTKGPLRPRAVPRDVHPEHALRIMLGRTVPMSGEIDVKDTGGLHPRAYRCGKVWAFLIEVAGVRLYHQGSADLIDHAVPQGGVDVFLAGVAGREFTDALLAADRPAARPRPGRDLPPRRLLPAAGRAVRVRAELSAWRRFRRRSRRSSPTSVVALPRIGPGASEQQRTRRDHPELGFSPGLASPM